MYFPCAFYEKVNKLINNSMEQSISSEANSHSASQVIHLLIWNLKVRYHVCEGLSIMRPCVTFHNKMTFYDELLAPCPASKLDNPSSAVCDSLFSIFVVTLHIWRLSPPSTAQGQAMSWL